VGLVLNLRKEATHQRLMENQALRDGLFMGLLIANFLFALWLYGVVRHPAHLWYLLYLASAALFVFAYHHRGFAWIWSSVPIVNHFDRTSTSIATFGIVSMFLHELLGFREFYPKVARVLRGMAWLLLFCAAIQLLYPLDSRVFEWVYQAQRIEILELSTYALALGLTARRALAGQRLAAWVLLAMVPMIAALAIAMFAEVLRLPWMYEHRGEVVEIGLILENFALTLLLLRRVVQERRDHQGLIEKHLALELDFSRRLAQETDRNLRGTAMDLHDGVGQELAGMSIYLRTILKQAGKPELTESVSNELGRVMESVRQSAHRIYPPELMEGGLRHALDRLAKSLRVSGKVSVSIEGSLPNLQEERAIHWYRIIQEAISNAQRHGQARHISVRLMPGRLEVEDDGIGLPAQITEGLGLHSLRHRAALLDAELVLAPSPTGPGALLSMTTRET
jgi:signal transduction histidine kinase